MAEPTMKEAEWLTQVTELAEILGWSWVHFRPAKTRHGWRAPVSGPLGKGWPDLTLVHPRHGIVFAELKGSGGRLDPDQIAVHATLREAGAIVYVWWPEDLTEAQEALT